MNVGTWLSHKEPAILMISNCINLKNEKLAASLLEFIDTTRKTFAPTLGFLLLWHVRVAFHTALKIRIITYLNFNQRSFRPFVENFKPDTESRLILEVVFPMFIPVELGPPSIESLNLSSPNPQNLAIKEKKMAYRG